MTPAQIESYVDAAADLLGMPLRPEDRTGVLGYFALAAGFADLIEAVPLAPSHEPAIVFVPVVPMGHAQ